MNHLEIFNKLKSDKIMKNIIKDVKTNTNDFNSPYYSEEMREQYGNPHISTVGIENYFVEIVFHDDVSDLLDKESILFHSSLLNEVNGDLFEMDVDVSCYDAIVKLYSGEVEEVEIDSVFFRIPYLLSSVEYSFITNSLQNLLKMKLERQKVDNTKKK